MARATGGAGGPTQDKVMDAVLGGSRVLLAIAARSLAASGEDVTLPQYRALVILAYNGPQRTVDLAETLAVNSSTATRMIDRLVRRGVVRREAHPDDRRASWVAISEQGRAIVASVTERRRREFGRILRKMGPESRRYLVQGLEALNNAADEAPEPMWALGWSR
jgi:DNA-binding MarR family transcriptional regulator